MDTKEKTGKKNAKPPVKKTEKEEPRPLQDVVYMPPKPFMRNRLLLRLATVGAIVLALVLAMSVFFRVEHIQVSGMDQYTAWDVSLASGIHQGDSLFSLELPAAAAKIKELNYVKDVRIGIRLPNMVIIDITEVRVNYAIKGQGDDWWLVDSSGRIIEKAQNDAQESCTKILGVHLQDPKVGERAVALETSTPGVDEDGNTIPVTVTAAHRLNVALDIADNLENNGIIGQAASIDVNDLGNIQFWYGQQYQAKLGDESQLFRKISLLKGAIDKLNAKSHNSGVLKVLLNDLENDEDDEIEYTRFQ
jgi:cell division septal protein FtsQ